MRIPLIEALLREPLPAGSNILVEYDAASQWYAASRSIAAGFVRAGGTVSYSVSTQPPEKARLQFKKLGLNLEDLEKKEQLLIWDWYGPTLGQESKEKGPNSVKVADLSIIFSPRGTNAHMPIPDELRIMDDLSFLTRFNDEKACLELWLSRMFPFAYSWKSTLIAGIIRGVHSDWVYRRLEAAADGVIDFTVEEKDENVTNSIRIRLMRNVGFDSRWHQLKLGGNFEVTIKK